MVTVDTVTAQLVYEIGGPAYAGPDVVAHLDSITLAQESEDRVSISGVTGSAPPATTKVALNSFGGFRNSVEFVLTGLDIEAKAALVRLQVEDALAQSPAGMPDEVVWDLDRTDSVDPETQGRATALLRCHVKSLSPDPVGRAFSSAAVELALASYAGFTVTRPPAAGTPYGVYTPAYVPQKTVPHTVVLADGTRIDVPSPAASALASHSARARESVPAQSREDSGPSMAREHAQGGSRVPLGRVVHARSGDKGGDANVGVWVRGDVADPDAAYAWLVDLLDADTFTALIPEAAGLDLEIHPLPNLRAVNVVAHGFLGDGVAASTRFDPQAKALGEWLRARVVDVPEELLP